MRNLGNVLYVFYLSHLTRHSFDQMYQSIVFDQSRRKLSGFQEVLIENTIVTCLE